MLYKKYHKGYVKRFKKGIKFKFIYNKWFTEEKITEELQVSKEPYTDGDPRVLIDIVNKKDSSDPIGFVIIFPSGVIRIKEWDTDTLIEKSYT